MVFFSLVLVFFSSTFICLFILATKNIHCIHSSDDHNGIQKVHIGDIPRIGGLAIYGTVIGYLLISRLIFQPIVAALFFGSLPVFAIGLLEDFLKKMSSSFRFFVTINSGLITYALTGIVIQYVGIWGVDTLLQYEIFAIIMTAFAIGGVTNAFNIIDGFNGLCAGVSIIILSTIAIIAFSLGDYMLVHMSVIIIVATLGFFIFNFPYGKIFLGDGGAYFLGFCIAWLLILLPYRHEEVLPWTSLLICSYPIIEVFYSIIRRIFDNNTNPFEPDGCHLHTFIYKKITSKMTRFSDNAVIKNALVSPFIWGLKLFPCVVAIMFYDTKLVLVLAFFAFVCVYCVLYRVLSTMKTIDDDTKTIDISKKNIKNLKFYKNRY